MQIGNEYCTNIIEIVYVTSKCTFAYNKSPVMNVDVKSIKSAVHGVLLIR